MHLERKGPRFLPENFGPFFIVAGVLGIVAVIGKTGLSDIFSSRIIDFFGIQPGHDLRHFFSLVLVSNALNPLTMAPGSIAILAPLSGEIAAATGIPLMTVLMTSEEHAKEFFAPYFRRIRDAYPGVILVFHNERFSNHYLECIPEAGTDVFFCGDVDLWKAKQLIGDRVTLMGNLKPLEVLLSGSTDEVIAESLECMEMAAEGGGFFLSNGGGLAAPVGSTPWENVAAMLKATEVRAARQAGR